MAEFGPPPPLTEDDLLEVLRRNFDSFWIESLLEDPSSRSLFVGLAAVLLRVQAAVDENLSNGVYILTAPGRASSTSTVRLSRPSGAEVTITPSNRFLDERGAVWRPIADFTVPLSGGPQTVDVPIQTERAGHFLDAFLPLTYLVLDPLPDPNLVVVQGVDPAEGGKTPFLDQHGKERRAFRAPAETDAQYRHRMLFLVDQVSPKAIADTVLEVLDSHPSTKPIADLIAFDGLRAVREPFSDGAQRAQRNLVGVDPLFLDDGFWDDPVTEIRSLDDACAWFDVHLPTPADPDEGRFFLDDGFWDDPEFAFLDEPPGPAITLPLAALADELDRRRAACVGVRIIVGEDAREIRHPARTWLDQAGDWADQDGVVTARALAAALANHDGNASYDVTTTAAGPGAPSAAGDLRFLAPAVVPPSSITRIRVYARALRLEQGGTDPLLQFVIRPSTAGAFERVGTPIVLTESYQRVELVLEENPIAAAPWTLADIAGTFGVGVANVAAAGPTDEVRVSELTLEFQVDHG